MIAAGLLARKAVERGLTVRPHIKTSLAPGSRVVTDYLARAGLLPYLERLGFNVAAYGCTTCIGNAGDLTPELNAAIGEEELVCAAVLSGNRNFEARIHPNLKANFLASPPLVVAYALAGSVLTDLTREPLAVDRDGRPVYLRELWPSPEEIGAQLVAASDPASYRRLYADFADGNPMWSAIAGARGDAYDWPASTYIARPPFFAGYSPTPTRPGPIRGARALAILGDSVTTDHISPAGSIQASSPAGLWLQGEGVRPADFNSYGARRGHHEVMMRGTFANVRIRNLLLPPDAGGKRPEGGLTRFFGPPGTSAADGGVMPIFDAAMRYQAAGVPTVIFGGEEYGTGSSRDWAAKGTRLLGVRAVIARSFERIHRANLVGMGVLPLQFIGDDSVGRLAITGDETFAVIGIDADLAPQQQVGLRITDAHGQSREVPLLLRIDTPVEIDYYRHDGILPCVLRRLLA
jgi:aconitate hydratase